MKNDVLTQVFEMTGKAGFMVQTDDFNNEAMIRYLKMSDGELEEFVRCIVAPSGRVINWHRYIRYNKDILQKVRREYYASPAWKRKRDFIMTRAKRSFIPDNPKIFVSYDKYGRKIQRIETIWMPVCEKVGCKNRAEHVHHLTYENLGKEELEDLQALCKSCHKSEHKKL